MGKLQGTFEKLLSSRLKLLPSGTLRRPSGRDLVRSHWSEEGTSIYRSFGGLLNDLSKAAPGAWDMETDLFAVELDEAQHFNRYRAITLRSQVYEISRGCPCTQYLAYCRGREMESIKKAARPGKYWTTNSCERQFGPPAPIGDFSGYGSPRWKQRAFYDFLKDLAPDLLGVSLARISIWDVIIVDGREVTVERAIRRGSSADVSGLIHLLESRRSGIM